MMPSASNVIPFPQPPRPEAQSWERSFPPASVEGADWVIDVLDDLIAYCAHHHFGQIQTPLATARGQIAQCLGR